MDRDQFQIRRKQKPNQSLQQEPGRLLLSEPLSGTIIIMWADLTKVGFPEHKRERWFVVLGRSKSGTEYILLPMTTFNGQGKASLDKWPAAYFKSGQSKPHELDHDTVQNNLTPERPVYFIKHRSRPGSPLAMATAFIVKPDSDGCIPATIDGYVDRQSFEDGFNCCKHLRDCHGEYTYLLETNMRKRDISEATSERLSRAWDGVWCDEPNCSLVGMVD